MDPIEEKGCEHAKVSLSARVEAIEGAGELRNLELQAICGDCGVPMVFAGIPISPLEGVPRIEQGGRAVLLPILPFTVVYPEVVAAAQAVRAAQEEAARPKLEIIGRGFPRNH